MLSKELGISAANLSEILRGKNSPSAEVALHMLEILESQSMATHVFTPKPDRAPRVQDPDNPMTLFAAKERIQELNAELSQLKSAQGMTGPTGASQPAPTPKPTPRLPASVTSATPKSAWERETERARQARQEGLSAKPLQEQTVAELQIALGVEEDDTRRVEIYNLLQQRKADARLSNPRARLGGK